MAITTGDRWTRDELVATNPEGSVGRLVDDVVEILTSEEWAAWIDSQVGQPKDPFQT